MLALGERRLLNNCLKSQLDDASDTLLLRERGDKEVIAFYWGPTLTGKSPAEEQMTPALRRDACNIETTAFEFRVPG